MKKDTAEVQSIVEGFLKYLEANRKLPLLPQIAAQLSKQTFSGNRSAKVLSATPLSAASEKSIRDIIKGEFGSEEIIFNVDETLVGGLKVIVGSQVLDLSFKARLEQLAA